MAAVEDGLAEARRLAATVDRLADHLGVPSEAVRSAIERLASAAVHQAQHTAGVRERILDALLDDLDLHATVPRAVVEQAHRVAARRRRLVADGAWSVSELAQVRGVSTGAVHTWLSRQRDADRLFTVNVGRDAHVPALLLDDAAEPHPRLERVIAPLRGAGMDPWAMWVWFDTPSPWLDGDRPADVVAAAGDTDRAAQAAAAQASNAAGAVAADSAA